MTRKNTLRLASDAVYLLFIYVVSLMPTTDPDIWFHLKSGETILKLGIIHYDVFSFVTAGREWFPYEWLFQVGLYLYTRLLGFSAVPYLTALLVTVTIGVYVLYLRHITGVPRWISYVLSFGFYVGLYDFISPRPHLFQYLFTIVLLFLIHDFQKNRKNRLWIILPLIYLWANMHASVLIALYIIGTSALTLYIYGVIRKKSVVRHQGKTLLFYGIGSALLSVAPPIGLTQYRLAWFFAVHQYTLRRFVSEWMPLITYIYEWYWYYILLVVSIVGTIYAFRTKKKLSLFIPLVPLLLLILSAFPVSRNIVMGYAYLGIIIAYCYVSLKGVLSRSHMVIIGCGLLLMFSLQGAYKKYFVEYQTNYPIGAVRYLLTHHLSGNMYNSYNYGGYLLYSLYPEYKIFIDARTDLYVCCELPKLLDLYTYSRDSDKAFSRTLYRLILDPYHISIAILPTENTVVFNKMRSFFDTDPLWVKLFTDQTSIIYVRKDGKNDIYLMPPDAR